MQPVIVSRKEELNALCKRYAVKSLYLFGSAVGDRFNDQSDFDFLVSFQDGLDPVVYADNFFALKEELEKLLGRRVDLITERSLSNPYFIADLEQHRQLLYAA
jgi:predicted nucleotidyltransferase